LKFGHLILRKIFKFVATNAPNLISAGASPQTSPGELSALRQTF